MQHVFVCQTNVTLHSGSLTRENVGGAFALFLTDGCICPLIHPPAISIQTEEDLSLKDATLVLMFTALCICLHFIDSGLVVVHFHSRRTTEATQRVCEFAGRNFWSCTIDQVWCRCWSGIPKCAFFSQVTSKILIQQLFLEHCIWFLAHQRWLISKTFNWWGRGWIGRQYWSILSSLTTNKQASIFYKTTWPWPP